MAILNPTFPQQISPGTASFSWFDLAEGVAYTTFYGFSTDAPSATGEGQSLTTSSLYSNTIAISGSTTDGLSMSGSYVTSFNIPRDVKGNAYVSFGWFSNTNDMFPFCKLYKRKDAIDTLLVQASGSLVANAVQDLPKVATMILDVPLTHFSIGDSLVLQAGITAAAGGAGAYSNVGQDPLNRDALKIKPSSQAVTTKMILNLPFRTNTIS